jgi:hypothetical protein
MLAQVMPVPQNHCLPDLLLLLLLLVVGVLVRMGLSLHVDVSSFQSMV